VEGEVVRRVTSVNQPNGRPPTQHTLHEECSQLEALIVGVLRKVKNFYTKTHKNHTESYPKVDFSKLARDGVAVDSGGGGGAVRAGVLVTLAPPHLM
jgi:hypothetical protein